MGAPVARTFVPRARPAVAWSAMPRTVTGSTWLCTSRTSGSGRSHSTTKAVLIGGSDFAVEAHVHDGASNRYDYTHRRNRIH